MKRVLKLLLIGIMVVFPNIVYAETLDVNSDIVKELNEKYLIIGNSSVDFYYLKNTINVEKMSNQEKGDYLARINFIKEGTVNQESNIETISEEEYNAGYKKLYGPDQKIIQLKEEEADCLIYWFDSANHVYKRSQGCGYGTGPSYKKYIVSASKEGEYISINIKAYYDLSSETDDSIPVGKKYIIPYNNDFNTSNRNMPVDSFDEKEVNSKYGDYIQTHKITFKKASDGEYYFYSTEHLNDAKEYKTNNTKVIVKENKKVSNPKTADQNIIIISVVGIICLGILFTCSRKILRH